MLNNTFILTTLLIVHSFSSFAVSHLGCKFTQLDKNQEELESELCKIKVVDPEFNNYNSEYENELDRLAEEQNYDGDIVDTELIEIAKGQNAPTSIKNSQDCTVDFLPNYDVLIKNITPQNLDQTSAAFVTEYELQIVKYVPKLLKRKEKRTRVRRKQKLIETRGQYITKDPKPLFLNNNEVKIFCRFNKLY